MRTIVCILILWASTALAQGGSKTIGTAKLPAGTEKRAAVIFANQDYDDPRYDLQKTHNDADDMKQVLESMGFDVIVFKKDLNERDFGREVQELSEKLKGYQVVFFYYSGHGAEYRGENYLVPTDVSLAYNADIETQGIKLSTVYEVLRDAGIKTSIVALDACRSLPVGKGNLSNGLTIPATNPAGTFTMYATRAGKIARENPNSRNSFFTQELKKHLPQPDLTLNQIHYKTRYGVKNITKNEQEPGVSNELDGEFVFLQSDPTALDNDIKRLEKEAAEIKRKQRIKDSLERIVAQQAPSIQYHTVATGETTFAIARKYNISLPNLQKWNQLETLYAKVGQKLIVRQADYEATLRPKVVAARPLNPTNGTVADLPHGPNMVFVEGGRFRMGSPDSDKEAGDNEKPLHGGTLDGFWISQTEVTVGQYLAFCEATNSHWPEWLEKGSKYHVETGTDLLYEERGYKSTATNLPVVGVSWDDAVAYCQWLRDKNGHHYRLPTEAEWEYAARGGSLSQNTLYAGSNDLDKVGWYSSNANGRPQSVAQKQKNELGLYDMSGNVWEWCADWYGEKYYATATGLNPSGPATGTYRVLRGGSWLNTPYFARVAFRSSGTPDYRYYNVGIRVVSQIQ